MPRFITDCWTQVRREKLAISRTLDKRTRPSPRRGRQPAAEEDPGLILISRRPPKQKFASFEEYIAAHGGVTAPVEGEADAQPDAPAPDGARP